MIRLRNCRRRKRRKTSVERLASGLLLPKLWLPMSPGYPCCCGEAECPCVNCQTDTTPTQLELDLETDAPFGNDWCADDCTEMNDKFILDQMGAGSCCYWRYSFLSPYCGDVGVPRDPLGYLVVFANKLGANYWLFAELQDTDLQEEKVWWEKDLGTDKPDCSVFSSEELTHDGGDLVNFGCTVDSNDSVYVTSV